MTLADILSKKLQEIDNLPEPPVIRGVVAEIINNPVVATEKLDELQQAAEEAGTPFERAAVAIAAARALKALTPLAKDPYAPDDIFPVLDKLQKLYDEYKMSIVPELRKALGALL